MPAQGLTEWEFFLLRVEHMGGMVVERVCFLNVLRLRCDDDAVSAITKRFTKQFLFIERSSS